MTSSAADQIRAEYDDESGALFWSWLQQQVTESKYEAYRRLPLQFVKQLCRVDWHAYVEKQVGDRLREQMRLTLAGLLKEDSPKSIILDEAWQFEPGKPR